MKHSSEQFTRYFILKYSQKIVKDKKLKSLILEGDDSLNSNESRKSYFWFGAVFFTIVGFLLMVLAVAVMALTIIFYKDLGLFYIPIVSPSFIMYSIGGLLTQYEYAAKDGGPAIFKTKQLLFAILAGLIMSLFVSL